MNTEQTKLIKDWIDDEASYTLLLATTIRV